jgi:hypothetical protein
VLHENCTSIERHSEFEPAAKLRGINARGQGMKSSKPEGSSRSRARTTVKPGQADGEGSTKPKAAAPSRKRASKSAEPSSTQSASDDSKGHSSSDERARRVAVAAYYRAERRGFAPGYEIEDWLAAEAETD